MHGERQRRIPLERGAGRLGMAAEASDLVAEYQMAGDFKVPQSDYDEARRDFRARSSRSRTVDKMYRAPITTNLDHWQRMRGRGVDYPGIDTPTRNPEYAITDLPGPTDRRRFAGRREGRHGAEVMGPRDYRGGRGGLMDDVDAIADRPLQIPTLGDLLPREYL